MSFSDGQYLTPHRDARVDFSRRFGSTTTGRVGGNCSISAVQWMANRVLPTSKIILSLTTSSAARRFGNSMTPCIGCGPSCAALLFPPGPLFLAASFSTATGPRFLPFRILAIGSSSILSHHSSSTSLLLLRHPYAPTACGAPHRASHSRLLNR